MNQNPREHFDSLTHEQQLEAIHRLAAEGHGCYSIAAATALSVEQVRRILGQREHEHGDESR